jgi:hypothetical protein
MVATGAVRPSTPDPSTVATCARFVADHGIRITLMGPATFPTGEPVAFTADVDGTDDWAWVGPDNAMVVGSDQSGRLELEPRRPGEATLGAGRPGR